MIFSSSVQHTSSADDCARTRQDETALNKKFQYHFIKNVNIHKLILGFKGTCWSPPHKQRGVRCQFVSIYLLQFCQLSQKTASKHIIYDTQHRLQWLI